MSELTSAELHALRADAVNLAAERSPHGHPLPDSEIRAAWAGVDAVLAALRAGPTSGMTAAPVVSERAIEEIALMLAVARSSAEDWPNPGSVSALDRKRAEQALQRALPHLAPAVAQPSAAPAPPSSGDLGHICTRDDLGPWADA